MEEQPPGQEGGKSVALKEAVPKPEDDEDISIDFSKIKAFFRGKKKEGDSGERKVKAASKEPGDEDDDLTIDFSKIKAFFKRDKGGAKDDKKEDDLDIDFRKVAGFITAKQAIRLTKRCSRNIQHLQHNQGRQGCRPSTSWCSKTRKQQSAPR